MFKADGRDTTVMLLLIPTHQPALSYYLTATMREKMMVKATFTHTVTLSAFLLLKLNILEECV